ncbi:DM13 domain-containing protein [Halomonas denitrificans]|nr:DM13 domain-containing protein [Halomonas denitrificans]
MNVRKTLLLLVSHALVALLGFAGGIYALPILTAPAAPDTSAVAAVAAQAEYRGEFVRDLADSDALHWGEGTITLGNGAIALEGKLAPGPDYQLYLSPEFVETEADFNRLKAQMVRVGAVKTFDNFLLEMPSEIDPARYTSVIIWCESFGQFITAAQYRG